MTVTVAERDAAALRLVAPRGFTQEVSRFLYAALLPSGAASAGVAFQSRHGDGQKLWAIFERDTDLGAPRSRRITDDDSVPIAEDHPDLVVAMTLHHLEWS